MSSFQALMALSASQTKQSQGAVQLALQERQRKEAMKRKEQEEQDRKDKERETKLRLKHFEEQKKEEERLRREAQKREAMEAARQRREDEQRHVLLYGPKKASKWPTSTSGAKEAIRRSRLPSGADDDADGAPAGSFLTREELRERKQAAEQRRLYSSTKRSSSAGGYSKRGKRLPGGAVDITTTPAGGAESDKFKNVKDRLASQPMTLTKLNVVKRDTRTIDEIVQDRAKVKILDGDKAREFSDWFGTSKKKDKASPTPASSNSSSQSSIATFSFVSGSQSTASAVTSGTNTPVSQRGTPVPSGVSAAMSLKKTSAQSAKQASISASSKTTLAYFKSNPPSKPNQSSQTSKFSTVNGKLGKSSAIPSFSSQPSAKMHSHTTVSRKRPRSESRSESPPPKRRVTVADNDDDDDNATESIGSMIWNMFGRNRNEYVSRDVFSDDEDMEADASCVAREEAISARIAAKEDQIALEEERRREEEKRRKKKERDARPTNSR